MRESHLSVPDMCSKGTLISRDPINEGFMFMF
jgi:hypothetical protein